MTFFIIIVLYKQTIKNPDELTGQTACTMSKEIVIYITKQLDCNGNMRFLLSSNKTDASSWFKELPPQKEHGDQFPHEGFNHQLTHVLHSCNLQPGEHDFKVLYNQEFKTTGKYVVGLTERGLTHGFKNTFDNIKLNEKEILHFMKLFREYKK